MKKIVDVLYKGKIKMKKIVDTSEKEDIKEKIINAMYQAKKVETLDYISMYAAELQNDAPQIRIASAQYFESISSNIPESKITFVVGCLLACYIDFHADVREYAASALAAIINNISDSKGKSIIEILIVKLRSNDMRIEEFCIAALTKINPAIIESKREIILNSLLNSPYNPAFDINDKIFYTDVDVSQFTKKILRCNIDRTIFSMSESDRRNLIFPIIKSLETNYFIILEIDLFPSDNKEWWAQYSSVMLLVYIVKNSTPLTQEFVIETLTKDFDDKNYRVKIAIVKSLGYMAPYLNSEKRDYIVKFLETEKKVPGVILEVETIISSLTVFRRIKLIEECRR